MLKVMRGAGGAALVVVALAVGAGWSTGAARVADRIGAAHDDVERALVGTITPVGAATVAVESTFAPHRAAESRPGASWTLPGLTAALAALCLWRRLRALPLRPGSLRQLRDWVSRRGPPVASLA
jgi:hypothetical protein